MYLSHLIFLVVTITLVTSTWASSCSQDVLNCMTKNRDRQTRFLRKYGGLRERLEYIPYGYLDARDVLNYLKGDKVNVACFSTKFVPNALDLTTSNSVQGNTSFEAFSMHANRANFYPVDVMPKYSRTSFMDDTAVITLINCKKDLGSQDWDVLVAYKADSKILTDSLQKALDALKNNKCLEKAKLVKCNSNPFKSS